MKKTSADFLAKTVLPAAVFLFAGGCGREEIQVYRVPKETNQVATTVSQGNRTGDPHAQMPSRPEVRWTELPAGWKAKEMAPGSMRAATFVLDGTDGQKVEVAVTPFVGAGGIESGSLNMWRGELGLPPSEGAAAESSGERVPVGGSEGMLYDFNGTREGRESRIVGAVTKQPGATWFFKMWGDDRLVAEQKPAFTQFLRGVSFVEGTSGMEAAAANAGAIPSAPQTGGPAQPKWEAPPHWQLQPAKTMVIASYTIPAEGGKADVAISAFPGDVGGLTANLTRWRRQMGLGPVAEADVSKLTSPLDVGGTAATFVEMTNDSTGTRLTAVIVPHAGMSWFFKLTGPDALVTKEKAGFIKFVQSVKFPTNA